MDVVIVAGWVVLSFAANAITDLTRSNLPTVAWAIVSYPALFGGVILMACSTMPRVVQWYGFAAGLEIFVIVYAISVIRLEKHEL